MQDGWLPIDTLKAERDVPVLVYMPTQPSKYSGMVHECWCVIYWDGSAWTNGDCCSSPDLTYWTHWQPVKAPAAQPR